MMQLIAPVSGIVTYGDPDRFWGNPEVKVGMDGRRKQVIITIPDMSKMIVDVNLPEQYRSKVSIGDPVVITPGLHPDHQDQRHHRIHRRPAGEHHPVGQKHAENLPDHRHLQ